MTWGKSHLTAIDRKRISAPARYLKRAGLLKGRVLDFGCGHGMDARALKCDRYDPHYYPWWPKHKYSTILVTYVLNVLPHEERMKIFEEVVKLANGHGCHVYFTVRRDLKIESDSQFIVTLDFMPTVVRQHGYEIYDWWIPGENMRGP